VLLVLDNLEQITAAAPAVARLLAAAPGLKVLAASRALLRVYGEHGYPVPPLSCPELRDLPPLERLAEWEAVQLFVQRAQAVQELFRRLAVFVGGFSLEAAEAVCGAAEGYAPADGTAHAADVLGTLEALVDQSLVQVVQPRDESRFSMLQTIREYASERLEADAEDDGGLKRDTQGWEILPVLERADTDLLVRKQACQG
jgi:predicted ATPase